MLLIVDDEKPTREGLRAALEDRYDVYVAEDAKAPSSCWSGSISACCSRISGCRRRTG